MCEVHSFIGLYFLSMNIIYWKHVWHIDKCVNKWNTNLWMNKCHTKFRIFFIKPCVKCVFNAWYLCVKCTNYEWMNFAQFPLLNCEMLSLWCRSKFSIYSTFQALINAIMKISTKFIDFSLLTWSSNSLSSYVVESNFASHVNATLEGFKHPIYGLYG